MGGSGEQLWQGWEGCTWLSGRACRQCRHWNAGLLQAKAPASRSGNSQRMGEKLTEVASGKNPGVRNRLLPLQLYRLGQNHSSAGQALTPSCLTCLCPCVCPGLLGILSLQERALSSLLAVQNPHCGPGGTGQDTPTRMDLSACDPQWCYPECPSCHSFHLQGLWVVSAVPGSSTGSVGLWRARVSKAPALQSRGVSVSGVQQRNCLVPAAFLGRCLQK